MDDISFKEEPYNRLRFVDLRNESEEMKWKILEYHNQPWVLAHIYGPPFTREQHVKFLHELPNIRRRHYIAYFDGYPIGKFSFDIHDNMVENTGDYLFFEKDAMTGLGSLMEYAMQKYFFEMADVERVRFARRKDNTSANPDFFYKWGIQIIGEDHEQIYFEYTRKSTAKARKKRDRGLKILFADFKYEGGA